MKISFIIPAYNEELVVGQCIESVLREIERGSYDAEVIVADNGSTDRTRDIALSYSGVRVVSETWKGPNRARQAGFKVATGDVIVNIDADCIVPPDWLSVVLNEFKNHKHVVAVSGPYIYHDLPLLSRALAWVFYGAGFLLYLLNMYILHSGSMVQGGNFAVRREALQKIGGYNTDIEFYGDDTDTARRLSAAGTVKWTFKLRMYSSGRRLKGLHIVATGFQYALNHIWVLFTNKPHTVKYRDIRHVSDSTQPSSSQGDRRESNPN